MPRLNPRHAVRFTTGGSSKKTDFQFLTRNCLACFQGASLRKTVSVCAQVGVGTLTGWRGESPFRPLTAYVLELDSVGCTLAFRELTLKKPYLFKMGRVLVFSFFFLFTGFTISINSDVSVCIMDDMELFPPFAVVHLGMCR